MKLQKVVFRRRLVYRMIILLYVNAAFSHCDIPVIVVIYAERESKGYAAMIIELNITSISRAAYANFLEFAHLLRAKEFQ